MLNLNSLHSFVILQTPFISTDLIQAWTHQGMCNLLLSTLVAILFPL